MKKNDLNFGIALAILSCCFLALPSCAPIRVKDDQWCADAGKFGAECFTLNSGQNKSLDKYEWDRLRVGQICSASPEPGRAFANFKAALLKACADNNRCTFEEEKKIERAAQRIEAARRRLMVLGVMPTEPSMDQLIELYSEEGTLTPDSTR